MCVCVVCTYDDVMRVEQVLAARCVARVTARQRPAESQRRIGGGVEQICLALRLSR